MKAKRMICSAIIAISMHINSYAQDGADNHPLIFRRKTSRQQIIIPAKFTFPC